jgi:CRP/FNR family transcriptional regulator
VKADVAKTGSQFGTGATNVPGDRPADAHRAVAAFSAWSPATFSLSQGVEPNCAPDLERMLSVHRRLKRGQALYQLGGRFHALYALRTGTCKSVNLAPDGQDQIVGYHIAGEIVGIDGIPTRAHECEATALEDMDICPLPFDQIDDIARISDQFRLNFLKVLSQENSRMRSMMMMLGTMRAEQRLAMFLLDLGQRYCARGYSSSEFVLRMTRAEIGSYLGLQLETTSRLFSRFQRAGLVRLRGRAVKLLDRTALCAILESGAAHMRCSDQDAMH